MGFSSQMFGNEPIIHDSTPMDLCLPPSGGERGLMLVRGSGEDYVYGELAKPFPQELLIPRSEWQARIQEKEERKTRLSDLITQAGLPEKDQNGLSYCWIFGPTQTIEVVRMKQGQVYVSLSPASAGGPIKNFRNVGGWGKEGLEWISKYGLCPSSIWPDTSLDRRLYNDENKAIALKYRTTEWWECRPRNLDELVSLGLLGVPGAAGYNWQSHETMYVEPIWLDGTIATRNRNQWKGYGDKNFYILQGSRMLPDDLVAPSVVTGS